jgi:Cu/Ag efflux protein CusF
VGARRQPVVAKPLDCRQAVRRHALRRDRTRGRARSAHAGYRRGMNGGQAMRRITSAALLALASLAAQAQSVDGEVRKIDKAQGKITLKHGEIKSLDMPPMTMVFRVKEPGMLDRVAVGDKVRFDAAKVDGQYTVTAIAKVP